MDLIHDDIVSPNLYYAMCLGLSIAVIVQFITLFPEWYNTSPPWLQEDLWLFRLFIKEWVGMWGRTIGLLFGAYLILSMMKGFMADQMEFIVGLGYEGINRFTKWYTRQVN